MQFKPVPEPPANITVAETIAHAVPTDPEAVADCCDHLLAETSLSTRAEAATWLPFLRALRLLTEEPAGYSRSRSVGFDSTTQQAFRTRVYGADAVLETLEDADRPLSRPAVATAVPDRVVREDGERIERLLEWAVLFGLAERDGDQYVG